MNTDNGNNYQVFTIIRVNPLLSAFMLRHSSARRRVKQAVSFI